MNRLTEDRRRVGGVALGAIWIGDSKDEQIANLGMVNVGAILCVAQDMVPTRGWNQNIEAMHVGLVDGPGNEMAAYYAAILALHTLLKRHNVLVCCHTGGRSLAVAMMYLRVMGERDWDSLLMMLQERINCDLLDINDVHRDTYDKIDWLSLKRMVGQ